MNQCADCGKGRATNSPIPAFHDRCFKCVGKFKQRNRRISERRRLQVFARDGYRCVNCGCAEVDWLCIDHIHPVVEGGTKAIDNLQTLCFDCNERKGDSSQNVSRERRLAAARRLAAMEIEDVPDPEMLSRELERVHEPGGLY